MLIDEIAPEALKLPPKERALLAASLWESIGDPNDLAADIDDEEAINLALTRDSEIETGQVKALLHEDLMNRLRG